MLVLSRRVNEKILLPSLNIVLQVVGIKPGVVRIGIEAPNDVPILREEVADRSLLPISPHCPSGEMVSSHSLENHINAASLRFALLRRQAEVGRTQEMAGTIRKIEAELQSLREQVALLEDVPTPIALSMR